MNVNVLAKGNASIYEGSVILVKSLFHHTRGNEEVYIVFREGSDPEAGSHFLTRTAAEMELAIQTLPEGQPYIGINTPKGKTQEQMLAFFER